MIGPWFLEAFTAATGFAELHYVVLLPPESTCLERVKARAGHSFNDLSAAQHMYREFADAPIAGSHVLTNTQSVDSNASCIYRRVQDGAAVWKTNSGPLSLA